MDFISRLIDCLVETLDYSMLSLAVIASSFRVNEENLLFETVQSGPTSYFRMFSPLLKERTFICLYKVNKIISFAYYFPISYFPKKSSDEGFEVIIKSLDPLRAKKTFIRKTLGHTMLSAIKASSVTLKIWQKEPEENNVNLQILITAVVSKTNMF